jgi:hypothetical protein
VNDFWPAWELEAGNDDSWVSRGAAIVNVEGPNGAVLSTYSAQFRLAAGSIGWVVPDRFYEGQVISGKGSRVEHISLQVDPVRWESSDGSPSDYEDVQISLARHEVGSQVDVSLHPDYPRHSLAVTVSNASDFAMKDVFLFGLILDRNGRPVDIVATPARHSIGFGETETLTAISTSWTGRCIGARDPHAMYEVHYWIDFETYSGQHASRHAKYSGEAWDYEKAWEAVKLEYLGLECDGDDNIAVVRATNEGNYPLSIVLSVQINTDVSRWSRDPNHGWWSTDDNPVWLEPDSPVILRYLVGEGTGAVGGDWPTDCDPSKVIGYRLDIRSIDGVEYSRTKELRKPQP